MNADNRPGRHRAPGGYSPLAELKSLARDSAQPAMKGAAVVAAAGGLVATVANPSSARPATAPKAAVAAAPAAAAVVVGPAASAATSLVDADHALSTIGFTAAPATDTTSSTTKPVVIKDVVVEQARKAAAQRAAQQRASRDLTRRTLTTTTYVRKSTTNGTAGQRSSYNWATAGQCTWGALAQWYQSEGYYPGGWTGNALTWGYGAANAGYTVSSVPRTRSIVVMQPGVYGSSSAGHVAWVTAVNGNQVTFIEMNGTAGPYNYDTRTVTNISGMQYIYAP